MKLRKKRRIRRKRELKNSVAFVKQLRVSILIGLLVIVSPSYGQSLPTSSNTSPQLASQAQVVKLLTLDEALQRALNQPSAYGQAQLAEQLAKEDLRQSRTAFLPKVSAQSSYLYTSPGVRTPATPDNPQPPRNPSFISNNSINQYTVFLNIAGELDTSGKLAATQMRNRAALAAAQAQIEIAKKGLSLTVTDAYYGLALAHSNSVIAADTLTAAVEFLRITQLLYTGGEVAEGDVIRARIEVSNRRVDLEKGKAAESVAGDLLRILINTDLTELLAVSDLTPTTPIAALDLSAYTEALISNRPELGAFVAQLRAAEQDIKIARSELLPQTSYSLNLGVDDSSFSFFRDRGASFSVSLKMSIFDWGEIRSRTRQAQLRNQVLENERSLAMKSFLAQFYTARTNVMAAIARIAETEATIGDATRSLDIAIARYRAGEAPILEVTDARNTLANVRTSYYQAVFDYRTNLARLEQAVGR